LVKLLSKASIEFRCTDGVIDWLLLIDLDDAQILKMFCELLTLWIDHLTLLIDHLTLWVERLHSCYL